MARYKDAELGVIANGSSGSTIENVTFFETGSGVNISQSDEVVIKNNKFIRQTDVAVNVINNQIDTQTNRNQIDNNEFYETTLGVRICGANADYNTVSNNLFWKSKSWAINIATANNNVISNNRILESIRTPIRLISASHNRVIGNTLIGRPLDPVFTQPNGITLSLDSNDKCSGNGLVVSEENSIEANYISDFSIAIDVGSGITISPYLQKFWGLEQPYVGRNLVNGNRLIDNDLGIQFKIDAHQNNDYQGTQKQVENNGIGNTF